MKKKLFSSLSTLLLSGMLLVGCGNQTAKPVDEPAEDSENTELVADEKVITIDISVEGEDTESLSKELEVAEDSNLLEIMDVNYDIEATEDGFMTAIEGYEQDESEGLYWLFDVNGEMGEVGAADYIPSESDAIEWKLESFE